MRFRDFFLADVLTSMTTTLSDLAMVVYFCSSGDFTNLTKIHDKPNWIHIWAIVAGIIPFWFRFW